MNITWEKGKIFSEFITCTLNTEFHKNYWCGRVYPSFTHTLKYTGGYVLPTERNVRLQHFIPEFNSAQEAMQYIENIIIKEYVNVEFEESD